MSVIWSTLSFLFVYQISSGSTMFKLFKNKSSSATKNGKKAAGECDTYLSNTTLRARTLSRAPDLRTVQGAACKEDISYLKQETERTPSFHCKTTIPYSRTCCFFYLLRRVDIRSALALKTASSLANLLAYNFLLLFFHFRNVSFLM